MKSALFRSLASTLRVVLAITKWIFQFLRARVARKPTHVLDIVLFRWTRSDPFYVRSLLNNVLIYGRTGSGKTSSSGRQIGAAIVRVKRSSGLILAAKPEDLHMWQRIFASAGRSEDLLIFSPTEPLRFNFLSYLLRLSNGQTREIVQFIQIIGESLHAGKPSRGGDLDSFWEREHERLLYNAVEIVKRATGSVSAPELQRFIGSAAMSPEQVQSETFRSGCNCQYLEKAHAALKTAIETHDFQLAADYFLGEWPQMADKMRSSILASVMGILHILNTGLVRDLVSTSTNVSPDSMLVGGKWILVNMSPMSYGPAGSVICAGWKTLTQRGVLSRAAKSNDFFNVIWVDESAMHLHSFDATYAAQCRSHLGCLVYIGQSLPSYYVALAGDTGEHQAHSFLSNFGHFIFHAVDPCTAEWAVKKLGKRTESFFGGSSAAPSDVFDQLFGDQRITGSFSEHYENILQERVFITGLRTGSKINGFACDAIVIRSGEPFSSGENYLYKTFYQE